MESNQIKSNQIKSNQIKSNPLNTPKKIFYNILFYISAMSAGCLLIFRYYKVNSLFILAVIMFFICLVFSFDIGYIKRNFTPKKGIAAAAISFIIAYQYDYDNACWYSYGLVPESLTSYIGVEDFVRITAILGGIISAYSVLLLICMSYEKFEITEEIKHLKTRFRSIANLKKAFISLFLIYLLSIFTIIRSNVDYLDDIRRKFDGVPDFDPFSRFTSDILSIILNTSSNLTDISPLLQMIAVLIVALASLIVTVTFSENERISVFTVLAVVPLGLSPWFLECLSYKFDAPYMALSVFAGVFPLLFCERKRSLYITSVIISVLISCTTYQASLGIFPISIIMLAFYKWNKGEKLKDVSMLAVNSAIGYVIGGVIYKVFIMRPVDTYVGSSMYPISEFPAGIVSNLKKYVSLIFRDCDAKWIIFIALIFISFIVLSVVNSRKNKLLSGIVTMAVVCVSCCMSFGLYIALRSSLFECRAMYGFGACIALIAVVCSQYKFSYIPKIASFCLCWCFVILGLTYGNALAEQQRYIDFRTEMVLNDLDDIPGFSEDNRMNVQVVGSIGFSPVLENNPGTSRLLGRLIVGTFDGNGLIFNVMRFDKYYDLPHVRVDDLEDKDLPIIVDSCYHTIYGDEKNVLIELKEY